MKIAIIENNKVVNVVVGELDIVSELFDEVMAETETTGTATIGKNVIDGQFVPDPPFPSYTWNKETIQYDPPKPKPEGNYIWNEEELDWLPMSVKEPEV